MKKLTMILMLVAGCACGYFSLPSPEQEAARFTGVKLITLKTYINDGAGDAIEKQVILHSPEDIKRMLAALKFIPSPRSCSCLYVRWATFRTGREEIQMTIGPHLFSIDHGRRMNLFVMPAEFYTLFNSYFSENAARPKGERPASSTKE